LIAELLALASALLSACSAILLRIFLRGNVSTAFAVFITQCVNFIVFWVIYMLSLIQGVSRWFLNANHLEALIGFALSGVFVQLLNRIFYYEGLRRIGVPQTQAVIGASPFFVTLFEIFFLREELSLNFWFSSILIMLGILILSLKEGMNIKLTPDLLFPLVASISLAVGQILRRFSLKILDDPILGATVAITFSFPLYGLYLIISKQLSLTEVKSINKCRYCIVCTAGFLLSIMVLLTFYATALQKVSIVSLLQSTHSIWALLLSAIFLRKTEKIDLRVIMSVILTFLGVALLLI